MQQNYAVYPSVQQQPVVMQQPMQQPMHQPMQHLHQHQAARDWQSGICGCFDDIPGCLLTWCCGGFELCCCLSGQMGEHCCTPVCIGSSFTLMAYRLKLRTKYNIAGTMLGDCCIVSCCGACAQCQLKREIRHIEETLGYKPVF